MLQLEAAGVLYSWSDARRVDLVDSDWFLSPPFLLVLMHSFVLPTMLFSA